MRQKVGDAGSISTPKRPESQSGAKYLFLPKPVFSVFQFFGPKGASGRTSAVLALTTLRFFFAGGGWPAARAKAANRARTAIKAFMLA